MARNVLARGAMEIGHPLQPQEQFRRMQHMAAKRVMQGPHVGPETGLGQGDH